MEPRVILNSKHLELTINRLCYQLIENHDDFDQSVLIGLQPRGVFLAERIHKKLEEITGKSIPLGMLDVTFYRDDFRRRDNPLTVNRTRIDFLIEGKKVILVDDVLYTGRTIRSGLDAMLAFGRPDLVECLVLIDRRFSRQLPVKADYVGKTVDAVTSENVNVVWEENSGKVFLNTIESNE